MGLGDGRRAARSGGTPPPRAATSREIRAIARRDGCYCDGRSHMSTALSETSSGLLEVPRMNRSTSPRLVALGAIALAVATLSAPARGEEEEKVLNVYNWADYIAPDMIARFEKETGIKVRYDNFDTNEILHAKMVAGRSGYDIVVPSSYFGRMQLMGGLLRPIDRAQVPNWKNLDPAILEALAKIDPGNKYLVDWAWGYTTVGINVEKLKKALGDLPMPDDAWDLVFKPEYMKRLHRCGVSFLDSPTDVVPAAAHYLGKPSFSKNPADYAGVPALLKAIRPYVTVFSSSGYI